METTIATAIEAEDLVEQFGVDCGIRNLAEWTTADYIYTLRRFEEWLVARGLSLMDVHRNEIRAYIQHLREERGNKLQTIKIRLAAISSFYEYLVYEELYDYNPVSAVRKRYIRQYKVEDRPAERKIITVGEMAMLVNSIAEPRDKALVLLLAKTGIRRSELARIDVDDVDWRNWSIKLKPTAKRSNRVVYFDDETYFTLMAHWKRRMNITGVETKALFLNARNQRLQRSGVYNVVVHWTTQVGVHDPESNRTEDRFTPHCFRHWFTTELRRAGMSREFIKELRGDVRREAIDIYDHIDPEELKREYLARIPKLGV